MGEYVEPAENVESVATVRVRDGAIELVGEPRSMVTYLVGTDGEQTSGVLCDYLETDVTRDDIVHGVFALGANPTQENINRGEKALAVFTDRLGDVATVELHMPIRSTSPSKELLITAEEVGADRIAVGLRQYSTPERIIFGSTAQKVLKNTTRPVIAVPLEAT